MPDLRALITGVNGQDGAYLSEFLLNKGYTVCGLVRKTSFRNTQRIDHLIDNKHTAAGEFIVEDGDVTDGANLIRIMRNFRPGEIYNLAAQSHVKVSFDLAEYTGNCVALGTVRLLEAVRVLDMVKETRFYQASTSELFGLAEETPQRETTPFHPRSPYAVAKLYAYWIVRNYREAYEFFATNGILFNHESPRRGETFVTRKITRAAARIKLGLQEKVSLGNLNAGRDWGHARDYVEAMWMILQHDVPDDFVISTGMTHTVRDFAEAAFREVGIAIAWKGEGKEEKGIDSRTGRVIVDVNERFFRPAEVFRLMGDSSKAREVLGWKPRISFQELVKDMVATDLEEAEQELVYRDREKGRK